MYYKFIPSFSQFHKKAIKKIFQGLVLVAMSDTASYTMEETDESESILATSYNESNFPGSFSEIDEMDVSESTPPSKSELSHKTSEKCTFADWMGPLGRNTFNRKSLEDQQHIRKNVTRYASEISKHICEKIDRQMLVKRIFSGNDFEKEEPEDQEEIADYIRQIANDETIIKENPLLTIKNENNQNQRLVREDDFEKEEPEDQGKIANYIRQIANDENPIKESPLLAMKDENNPSHRLVSEIATVLYKIVTGEMLLINDKLTEYKIFAYMPEFSGLEQPSIVEKSSPACGGTI